METKERYIFGESFLLIIFSMNFVSIERNKAVEISCFRISPYYDLWTRIGYIERVLTSFDLYSRGFWFVPFIRLQKADILSKSNNNVAVSIILAVILK